MTLSQLLSRCLSEGVFVDGCDEVSPRLLVVLSGRVLEELKTPRPSEKSPELERVPGSESVPWAELLEALLERTLSGRTSFSEPEASQLGFFASSPRRKPEFAPEPREMPEGPAPLDENDRALLFALQELFALARPSADSQRHQALLRLRTFLG